MVGRRGSSKRVMSRHRWALEKRIDLCVGVIDGAVWREAAEARGACDKCARRRTLESFTLYVENLTTSRARRQARIPPSPPSAPTTHACDLRGSGQGEGGRVRGHDSAEATSPTHDDIAAPAFALAIRR